MTTTAKYNKAQQAAIDAIQEQFHGTRIVPGVSKKYVVMKNPGEVGGMKYFIGKMGAIRRGKTISDSFSLTDAFAGLVAKAKRDQRAAEITGLATRKSE